MMFAMIVIVVMSLSSKLATVGVLWDRDNHSQDGNKSQSHVASLSLFVSKSQSHIANVGDLETDCLGRDKVTFLYDWTGQTLLDRERNAMYLRLTSVPDINININHYHYGQKNYKDLRVELLLFWSHCLSPVDTCFRRIYMLDWGGAHKPISACHVLWHAKWMFHKQYLSVGMLNIKIATLVVSLPFQIFSTIVSSLSFHTHHIWC